MSGTLGSYAHCSIVATVVAPDPTTAEVASVSLAVCYTVGGAAGSSYSSTTPVALPLDTATWLDSGIVIPPGGTVELYGTGLGTPDGLNATGPDGRESYGAVGVPLALGRTPFSLVAYVGPANPGFGVPAAQTVQLGSSPVPISSAAGGRVWVGYNDLQGSYGDNTGSFAVLSGWPVRIAYTAFGPRDEGLAWIRSSGAIDVVEWDPSTLGYVQGEFRDGGLQMPEGWWESGRMPGAIRRLTRVDAERDGFERR